MGGRRRPGGDDEHARRHRVRRRHARDDRRRARRAAAGDRALEPARLGRPSPARLRRPPAWTATTRPCCASDALAKLRAGMWVQLREGSAWHDVEKLAPVLLEDGVDSRHALLVTDDMHPETLATVGHLNHAVRTAIAVGIDPLVAIQMATVNAAEYMGRRHDIGSIAPGRCADILLVEDLAADAPAPGAGRRRADRRARRRTTSTRRGARDTVRIARTPTVEDLRIARRRRSRAGARDRHGPRRAGHRAPGRRGAGGRRRGTRRSVDRPRQGREHRAPRRAGHDRRRLRAGARAGARRGGDHGRPRQPQPLRRRHGRRRHARRRRAPARDRRRDGRRRRRRGHRRGAPADRRA